MSDKRIIIQYTIPRYQTEFTKEMPEEFEILSLQIYAADPTLWILADPDSPKVTRHFRTVSNDQKMDLNFIGGSKYIGTILGTYITHLFLEC